MNVLVVIYLLLLSCVIGEGNDVFVVIVSD